MGEVVVVGAGAPVVAEVVVPAVVLGVAVVGDAVIVVVEPFAVVAGVSTSPPQATTTNPMAISRRVRIAARLPARLAMGVAPLHRLSCGQQVQ